MANEELVREILETYDLEPRIKQKIIGIAARRTEELDIHNFDDAYRYISELIPKFTSPYEERFFESLDSPLGTDSETTLHEVISSEYGINEGIVEREAKEIHADEILQVLENHVDRKYLDFVYRLFGTDINILLNTSSDQIIKNIPTIQARLESLAQKYKINGRLLIPRRPIISVDFDPSLKIKFRYRRFNGNPIAYFEKYEVYHGLSRYELAKLDSGLYGALLRRSQLTTAIPDVLKRSLTEDKKKEIFDYYNNSGGNVRKTAKHLNYSVNTVLKYLKEFDVELKNLSRSYTKHQLEQLQQEFNSHNPNIFELALRLGKSTLSVLRKLESLTKEYPEIWDSEKVARLESQYVRQIYKENKGRWKIFGDYLGQLLDEYGKNKKKVSGELGINPTTLSRLLSGNQKPGKKFLTKLSERFDVPYEKLEGLVTTSSIPANYNGNQNGDVILRK